MSIKHIFTVLIALLIIRVYSDRHISGYPCLKYKLTGSFAKLEIVITEEGYEKNIMRHECIHAKSINTEMCFGEVSLDAAKNYTIIINGTDKVGWYELDIDYCHNNPCDNSSNSNIELFAIMLMIPCVGLILIMYMITGAFVFKRICGEKDKIINADETVDEYEMDEL